MQDSFRQQHHASFWRGTHWLPFTISNTKGWQCTLCIPLSLNSPLCACQPWSMMQMWPQSHMALSTVALEVYLSCCKRLFFLPLIATMPEDMFKSLLKILFPTKPLPRAVNKKQNMLTWVSLSLLSPAFPLWGPQWVMERLWAGNTERSQERSPVSVKHADVREQRLCSMVLPRDTTPEIIGTYLNKLFIS